MIKNKLHAILFVVKYCDMKSFNYFLLLCLAMQVVMTVMYDPIKGSSIVMVGGISIQPTAHIFE